MKEKIALLRCEAYELNQVEKTLREGFNHLGGEAFLRKLVPPQSHLLLKPNLLVAENAGSLTITHHVLFEAVVRILKDYTPHIRFGDSPGFGEPIKAAEKSGLLAVAKKYGVGFEDFKETVHVTLPEGILCKSWEVAKAPYEADVLISLPRLKTHAMAYFTGAIKNQFGCISGTQKASWHTRMPNAQNFCKMLLDLNTLVQTDFAILDGIIAMQGNGPKSGEPYPLGAVLMGESLSAVDAVAVQLIGYNPLEIPTLKACYEHKWGAVQNEDITVLGEQIADMAVKDFKRCRTGGDFYVMNPAVTQFLSSLIAPDPKVVADKCVGCARCLEVCPETPKVITMKAQKGKQLPNWDMKRCIRCFCCQELCPVGAITVKHKPLSKILEHKK
jgi:uncharacterized protein (DUF362 family)/Pyruvate/2-oxoacid:ferredoxin oxidoreductase delta subunit